MTKLTLVAIVSACITLIQAASNLTFQTGKLVKVSYERNITTAMHIPLFTVQLGDLVYTARGKRTRRPEDVAQGLIVGDPVQAAINGESLIMLTPEGKELKIAIVQRERVK